MSEQFLRDHPWCAAGCGRPADHVDHVAPHRGDEELFWDISNLQSLCRSCHSAKTMRELNEAIRGTRSMGVVGGQNPPEPGRAERDDRSALATGK